jgi:hypothetical protein
LTTEGHGGLLVKQAERLLRRTLGREIRLHSTAVVDRRERSLVLRCDVTVWDEAKSVIVKRNLGDDGRGFTDWASLAFLSTLDRAAGIVPRFLAGDPTERFFIMEDLGDRRSLESLFELGDETPVVESLRSLAVSMAHLVVATHGYEDHFERLRETLPGSANLGRRGEAEQWMASRDAVVRWATELEIPLPSGFDAACAHVAAVYANPGDVLSFSHGDPAPSNNQITADRACLIDFEYAGYRHALYDVTGWDVLCPLPAKWLEPMRDTFFTTLTDDDQRDPLADDQLFREAWGTMCAYRALAMIGWMSPNLLVQDRSWVSSWTGRAALISTSSRLQRTTTGIPALQPLAELGARIHEELRKRWPELGDGAPSLITTRPNSERLSRG